MAKTNFLSVDTILLSYMLYIFINTKKSRKVIKVKFSLYSFSAMGGELTGSLSLNSTKGGGRGGLSSFITSNYDKSKRCETIENCCSNNPLWMQWQEQIV